MYAPPALTTLDDAFHTVRRSPALLGYYAVGTLPFVFALLYCWADLTTDAYAHDRVTALAFTLALLFSWKCAWRAVYCRALSQQLRGEPALSWTGPRLWRLIAQQGTVQPTGLLLLPLAALMTLPFAGVLGFYQSFAVLGDGGAEPLGALIRQSIAHGQRWPRQQWLLLAILTLCGSVVFANCVVALIVLPTLWQTLSGNASVFTRSGSYVLNSTLWMTAFALTYLTLDPLLAAVSVLRCFAGESVESGVDLRAALRRLTPALTLLICAAAAIPAQAAPTPISPTQLNRALDDVLHERQFAWRLPRQTPVRARSQNWFVNFTESAVKMIGQWGEGLGKLFRRALDGLVDFLRNRRETDAPRPGQGATLPLSALLYPMLIVVVLGLGVAFWMTSRSGRQPASVAAAPVTVKPVDLAAAEVSPEELPEDGWLSLARECLERGEHRLALRALYLAGLASLGQRQLLVLHAAKTNRDYQRELARRARDLPELQETFSRSIRSFESAWYGQHPTAPADVERGFADLQQMKAHAS